ncbi:hypothetical protein DMC30DRAFT_416562 [Rhodotorula diobovata]|uniref:Vacuolar ATPase assembly integral membrane protein VMA21 n=1 Tax=Rhodotorula diobovata TaxID=5288 RepID=A0A5C5FVL9_9BASI|nr:hypothetical protein DMC30DRAFT_416562 [Rhodotorula diobovata]
MFPATPLPPTPEHLKAAERTPEGHADLSEVMYKLAAFTVAMVLLPIGTYFLTRDHVFSPTTSLTYPAISAVTVANAVLIAFIWVAFREDAVDAEREKAAKLRAKGTVGKVE